MAGFNKSNRLTPPLMWAFRSAAETRDARKKPERREDGTGQRIAPDRKGTAAASIAEPVLRREVGRDLDSLLNTIALESTQKDVGRAPHARTSIINYGLPDMAHRSIDELLANDRGMERQIEMALKAFEPRLVSGTVRVKRDASVDPTGLKVRFVVSADLFCRPVDIPLEFIADVDVGTGRFAIARL